MAVERSFLCTNCGHELHVNVRILEGVLACPACDWRVTIPPSDGAARPDPQAITANPVPWEPTANNDIEPPLPDIQLKPGTLGESLAVPALLLPLLTAGFIYFGKLDEKTAGQVLICGTVLVTAILLASDAWYLGAIDAQGKDRGTGTPLFFGMLILWIVFFPMAFFRRRHFGRPNLGPLAIAVALLFTLSPFVGGFADKNRGGWGPFGILVPARDDLPPACDSPDVKVLLEDMIHKGPLAGQIRSIGRYREVKLDEVAKSRRGRCVVDTDLQKITVGFEVSWIDAERRAYQVRVLAGDEDPRGFLGIIMQPIPPLRPRVLGAREGGVLVTEVRQNEPADKAGLQPGDVIVRINDKTFSGPNAVRAIQDFVIDLEPGTEVRLEVVRGEERLHLPLKLGRRPEELP